MNSCGRDGGGGRSTGGIGEILPVAPEPHVVDGPQPVAGSRNGVDEGEHVAEEHGQDEDGEEEGEDGNSRRDLLAEDRCQGGEETLLSGPE